MQCVKNATPQTSDQNAVRVRVRSSRSLTSMTMRLTRREDATTTEVPEEAGYGYGV